MALELRVRLPLLVQHIQRGGHPLGKRLVLGEESRDRAAESAVLVDQAGLVVGPERDRGLPLLRHRRRNPSGALLLHCRCGGQRRRPVLFSAVAARFRLWRPALLLIGDP
ncbi:MAG: hypothetical protein IPG81_28880 [Sandaracinaceae bacterium]|nr:hypothetical protein [Sandaracinaceae bacterium]